MKYLFLVTVALATASALLANWGEDIESIHSVKHWDMDDRLVYVRGEITHRLADDGFMLRDDSGEIRVHLGNRALRDHDFHGGQHLEVKGRVEREHRHFDLEALQVKLHDGVIIGEF